MRWACAWLLTIGAVACFGDGGGGGTSGVPGSTRLPDLSAKQREDLCRYLVRVAPQRTVICDGNDRDTIGFSSTAECTSDFPNDPGCTATVDQTEACFEALGDLTDDEWCNLQALPAACSQLDNC